MSSARAPNTRRRRSEVTAPSGSPQTYFEGSAFGPRDAEAGAKVREWIRENPRKAVKLAKLHAAAFDRSHPAPKTTKRVATKKPSR